MHENTHRALKRFVQSGQLASKDSRIGNALRWRISAYEQSPELRNLIRPVPSGKIGGSKSTRKSSLADSGHSELDYSARASKVKPSFSQHRFKWGAAYYDEKIRDNVVFYESFSGRGILCNPEAIMRNLLNAADMSHLEHVWSVKDANELAQFEIKYVRFKNIRAVREDSVEYWNAICTAKYLFNNATFPQYFTKRPEQVYVNTWHGTPLKKMGYDSNEGQTGAKNVMRNFCQADFLISPNPFTTQNMYRNAYRLDGIFQGQIIEQGYPRIDHQFATVEQKERTLLQLHSFGLEGLDNSIVLYAPTWKGEDFQNPTNEAHVLVERIKHLEESTPDGYRFLIKVHQQVYNEAITIPEIKNYIVPNSVPTNDVLAISDILITDYSSIFFDFIASQKPIIFFTPDRDQYHGSRGVYLTDLPGPDLTDLDELSRTISAVNTGHDNDPVVTHGAALAAAKLKFCPNDDGNSTQRIVDIVFRGNPANLPTIRNFVSSKTSLLIYVGGMLSNGITASALNLLANLDSEKYDVSIWAPSPTKNSAKHLYDRIPDHVRQFLRSGSHPLTDDRHRLMSEYAEGRSGGIPPVKVSEVYRAEWLRSFGNSKFDFVIDFSGYAGFWAEVLLAGESTNSHLIWQHSDMSADLDRTVDGKKVNQDALGSVFNAYKRFDKIVSVSDRLKSINMNSLTNYAEASVFKSCRNSLDSDRLDSILNPPKTDDSSFLKVNSVSHALSVLAGMYRDSELMEMIETERNFSRIFSSDETHRFVFAGRFSPEKNLERMLKAFAQAHASNSKIELVLLGDGPLRAELEALSGELGIQDAVYFTGMVAEPYSYMKNCNVFVMSSDYEGQPMVILEALSLGLPVLSVDFGSVTDSLESGQGIVVPQDVDSLAEGMLAFCSSKMSLEVTFDYDAYNQSVLQEFGRILNS